MGIRVGDGKWIQLKSNVCMKLLLCDRFFPRSWNTHIYSLQVGSRWQGKIQIPLKCQSPAWWTNGFCWGSLQEYGWGVTYRCIKDSRSAASPKPTLVWVTVYKTWGNWMHCTTAGSSTGGGVLPRCPRWSEPLPGRWSASETSLFLGLPDSSSQQSLLFVSSWGGKGPKESDQLPRLPEAILKHLLTFFLFTKYLFNCTPVCYVFILGVRFEPET